MRTNVTEMSTTKMPPTRGTGTIGNNSTDEFCGDVQKFRPFSGTYDIFYNLVKCESFYQVLGTKRGHVALPRMIMCSQS